MNVPRLNETSTNVEARKALMWVLDYIREEERQKVKHQTLQSSVPIVPADWSKAENKVQGKWSWLDDDRKAVLDRTGRMYMVDFPFPETALAEMLEDGFDLPGKNA